MKIAVLDNDTNSLELVSSILNSVKHSVVRINGNLSLLDDLRQIGCDMLIIDWQAPDLNGVKLMQWARAKLPANLPVLFITSRNREDDIVAGLDSGADDYLVKPIRRGELIARVQALLRRAYPNQHLPEYLEVGKYSLETRSTRATVAGELVDLSEKEFNLALLLFRNLGRPLSRAYILESVWSTKIETASRTMDTHISKIRSKLNLRPENGFQLSTVYGYGYCLQRLNVDEQSKEPLPSFGCK
ncbi:response regulator transcription factor [Sapientia aquatica]|uniref:Response regulator transcription factor n=1 Tax=Sapientia aquatica TaxID=1549640 RepID=A0A4R5VNE9_9BURK|nr:response regulator transcription factor [Sapientia aquatica]TDK58983.1 response regulator transcription factor [Sapientia aquatica]